MPRCFLCPIFYSTSFSCWFEVFSLFGCVALEVVGKLPIHPIKKGWCFLTDVWLRFFYHIQAHKEIFLISHNLWEVAAWQEVMWQPARQEVQEGHGERRRCDERQRRRCMGAGGVTKGNATTSWTRDARGAQWDGEMPSSCDKEFFVYVLPRPFGLPGLTTNN